MTDTKAFIQALDSPQGKEILELGNKIKKLDKSNEKRTLFVILMSIITMTVLGYASLGGVGAVIFLSVTVIASFWLYYSSKKNVLLKYLTFYRSRIPRLIAMAEGVEVTAEEIPHSDLVSTLSHGKVEYRMCHRYGDMYIGFVKFMSGSEPLIQGVVYCVEGEYTHSDVIDSLEEHTVKSENGISLLFLPWVDDYLNGRVEMTDDLTVEALTRQYEHYLLGKSFKEACTQGE